MRTFLWVTAAIAAAVAVLAVAALPPRRIILPPSDDGTIGGVIHVHTNRSDGLSGPDEIARAAARAGIRFVIFTDHGDATRQPDAPVYRSGVLCLDGVEISTDAGHYVAIGMPAAPYPLGGEARGVVDDVHRLGGFGIAAHPDSPKPELRWRDWAVPFDAVEMLNLDTSWRTWAQRARNVQLPRAERWSAARHVAASLLTYPLRPVETVGGLLENPVDVRARWANLVQRRRVVTIAGADAHAKLALRSADAEDAGYALPLPGYETAFRVLSVHVTPSRPLSGNAGADAAALLDGIRAGHLYTAVDAFATPPSLQFTAANEKGRAAEGDDFATGGGPITLRVRTNAPAAFTSIVMEGTHVASGAHHEADFSVQVPDRPAVYWVDIRPAGRSADVSWVRSNPIYVRGPEPLIRPMPHPPVKVSTPIFDGTGGLWGVEVDPSSSGSVDVVTDGSPQLRFRFTLSPQISPAPVVALAYTTPHGLSSNVSRIALTLKADRPMRISLQLRAPHAEAPGERWQRSMYIAPTLEERTVFVDEFVPIGNNRSVRPSLQDVRTILFVIDPINTKRGTAGEIRIAQAALQQ